MMWTQYSLALMLAAVAQAMVSVNVGGGMIARHGVPYGYGVRRPLYAPIRPAYYGAGVYNPGFYRPGLYGGGMIRRWRRDVKAAVPDDVLDTVFKYTLANDKDECIRRAACEATISPRRFGKEAKSLLAFVDSLKDDPSAVWAPYVESARMGRSLRSIAKCRQRYSSCDLPHRELVVTARTRLRNGVQCAQTGNCELPTS